MIHAARCCSVGFVTLLCMAVPLSVYAEEAQEKNTWVKTNFDLFHSEQGGAVYPRINVDLGPKNYESLEHDGSIGSYYFMAGLEGRVVHTWSNELNNEPSWANMSMGILWNLSDMKEADGPPPAPDTTDELPDLKAYDYGGISAKIHAQVETDDEADNVNLVGGTQFVYTPMSAFNDCFMPPPSVLLAFEYVKPQKDEARELLDAEESTFPRLRAAILWNWAVGEKLAGGNSYLKNLAFQFHYRYFKEFEQPAVWEGQDFDKYDQFDYRLRYILAHTQRTYFELREIYVGCTTGRLIANTEDDDRFIVGVTLQ